eukprot:g47902.t1
MKLLKEVVAVFILLPRFLITAFMLWLLDILCIRKRLLSKSRQQREGNADDPPLCVSDTNRMFTMDSLRAIWYGQKLDFFKSAHVGSPAPNPEVVQLWDESTRLATQYADIADFLLVYIEEAHPSDGWISTDAPYDIPKHRSLQDRLKAASLMDRENPGCLVVADTMDNSSNTAYGAYFERLYVVRNQKVWEEHPEEIHGDTGRIGLADTYLVPNIGLLENFSRNIVIRFQMPHHVYWEHCGVTLRNELRVNHVTVDVESHVSQISVVGPEIAKVKPHWVNLSGPGLNLTNKCIGNTLLNFSPNVIGSQSWNAAFDLEHGYDISHNPLIT